MKDIFEKYQLVERSIQKTYHKELWTPFTRAVKRYQLIQEGDRVAVCISGGKDSMLMAKLVQMLHRHSEVPFEVVYLVMDPGYNEQNRKKIEENAVLHTAVRGDGVRSEIFAFGNGFGDTFTTLIKNFYEGGEVPTFREGAQVTNVCDAIRRSAQHESVWTGVDAV